MKRLFAIISVFCVLFSFTAFADEYNVQDDAGLLTSDEWLDLEGKVATAKLRYQNEYGIAIKTVDYLSGYSDEEVMEEAEYYFNTEGFGEGANNSGILMLLDISGGDGNRILCTYASGDVKKMFTDGTHEYIREQCIEDFLNYDIATAMETFIDLSDEYIGYYLENGAPIEADSGSNIITVIGVAIVGGIIIAAIVAFVLTSQLKSVKMKPHANEYVKQGSMNVTHSQDIFLYRTVTRTARPKNDSSSSSGGSSGGVSRF